MKDFVKKFGTIVIIIMGFCFGGYIFANNVFTVIEYKTTKEKTTEKKHEILRLTKEIQTVSKSEDAIEVNTTSNTTRSVENEDDNITQEDDVGSHDWSGYDSFGVRTDVVKYGEYLIEELDIIDVDLIFDELIKYYMAFDFPITEIYIDPTTISILNNMTKFIAYIDFDDKDTSVNVTFDSSKRVITFE